MSVDLFTDESGNFEMPEEFESAEHFAEIESMIGENKHSSDGMAEDIIRSFVQAAAGEMHMKTLIEKKIAEVEEGLTSVDDMEEFESGIDFYKSLAFDFAELRRKQMLYLFEMYGCSGDKGMWCTVKHAAIMMITSFEVWQASNNDAELHQRSFDANRIFIKCLSKFIGVEITSCAACFADMLKGKEV